MKSYRRADRLAAKCASLASLVCLLVFALAAQPCAGQATKPGTPAATTPTEAPQPLIAKLVDAPPHALFAFLSWEKKVTPVADGVRVMAPDGKGGFTFALENINLSSFADWTPRLTLTVAPGNGAKVLSFSLKDADETSYAYSFRLDGLTPGQATTVVADDGASLREPGGVAAPGKTLGLDLTNLTLMVLTGDFWTMAPVEVTVSQVDVVAPDDTILNAREALRARLAREAEAARKAEEARIKLKADTLANPGHVPEDPNIIAVGAVAPDIIELTIQEKEYTRVAQVPYIPQETDVVVSDGEERLTVVKGQVVMSKTGLTVQRKDARGRMEDLGRLAVNASMIKPKDESQGKELSFLTVAEPAAYRISSADDPAYATPVHPKAVSWKRKPNAPQSLTQRDWVFLQLPTALTVGKHYKIELTGINTHQAEVMLTHDPAQVRSDAVHVSSVGFRPDDPWKRGFLSLWMGTGGPLSYAGLEPMRFQVVDDATGEVAFRGDVKMERKATEGETWQNRNYAKSDVYTMDFSALNRPGRYRLMVEGIGCSYPFDIGRGTWEQAVHVSMLGFLSQRSGIAIGPPYIDYSRPRDMCPADGFKVFASKFSPFYATGDLNDTFKALAAPENRTDQLVPEAWGGYHDAGDWNPRDPEHLNATYQLIELYDLFPEFYDRMKLSLPPAEAQNTIPDILDEALWNLDLFRRLQQPDGGVRGGIESVADPRPGEASWQESLYVSAYPPDPRASYTFAAVASQFARVAEKVAPALSATYRAAAIKAWDWAEADLEKRADAALWAKVESPRSSSTVQLLWLTGETRFQDVYAAMTVLTKTKPGVAALGRQRDATFTYARLPEGRGDAALKTAAKAAVVRLAESAISYGDKSSFGISSDDTIPPLGFCGYFTKPGMYGRAMPRAYYLTNDPKYLAGAIRACQFGLGANPDNTTYTTGIGPNPIKWPLHVDSEMTGQPSPVGITVCGISDPEEHYAFEGWAHQWYLDYPDPPHMFPNSYTWPAYESYWDIFVVPSTNEYQPHFLAQSVYYWGFLAARK
jgi:endoglucanase